MLACVAPNPSIDRLFSCPAVVPGTIHRPDDVVLRAGGKGLNVARAAAALGADVVAVALLAGHAGRWIADQLAAARVEGELVWGAGETRSSLSVASGGTLTEFYERGDPPGAAAWTAFRDAVARAAAAARWVSISGSMPAGVPAFEAGELVRLARGAGACVAVDQHGPTLAAALAAQPDLVKVNAAEAAEATGEGDPAAAARALGAPVAIVTLGEAGAVVAGPGRRGPRTVGLDVRGPYPVGSGDAFLAGLLTAAPPDPHGDWAPALALALGAAAANAEQPGAGTLDPARARALAAGAAA